jgi:hypothetical protein
MTKASGKHPLGGFADHASCCSTGKKRTFSEKGCKLYLPTLDKTAGTWICLAEKPYRREHSYQDKMCDLLLAWQKARDAKLASAPFELKSGDIDVSHVRDQLQYGANIIDDLLKAVKQVTFLPVLVHGPFRPQERRMLERQRILFRGTSYGIFALKSGGSIDTLRWQ